MAFHKGISGPPRQTSWSLGFPLTFSPFIGHFFPPYPGSRLMQSKCLWLSAGMAITTATVTARLLPMAQNKAI